MAIAVEMPKMSDTMEEGVLVAWLAEEGQKVSAGDVIAQVETDKATMDLEVYDDGVLLKRVIEEGSSVPIGALIAVLGKEGEDPTAILSKYSGDGAAGPAPTAEPADEAPAEEAEAAPEAAAPAPTSDNGRVKASPLARRMAGEHGIDLAALAGSGPDGRVIKRDVEAAIAGDAPKARPAAAPAPERKPEPAPARKPAPAPEPAASSEGAYDAAPISQMRKAIARRLGESKFTSPHFYLTVDVDMAKAVSFRKQLNAISEAQGKAKVSFNDLITKSCALALRQHKWVNSSWMEDQGEIHHHNDVHVAIAVAIDDGLITPVIRHADRKGLAQIAAETRELAGRAREKQLQPEEYSGSTFSTSNLGMFGIEEFTAIINPPNACIMAIGAIRDTPVVVDGAVVPGKRMKLTMSCDHRVVDGATGSEFLATVRQYLEEPASMLL
ncbi:MAG: pyruvate dehydrogenase complex dihydrolipoamide acetyltransferase [Rhodothermales bacterium]|nr:pyruvate dehydrogenase complex dihydrolipoamide acetyltransferase [Rhodothermales bacterium]MBO6780151.1 pyruvate dehydrogenase complex dihydrolipoamide acetyltransferase [Rhodothermales bacterium]